MFKEGDRLQLVEDKKIKAVCTGYYKTSGKIRIVYVKFLNGDITGTHSILERFLEYDNIYYRKEKIKKLKGNLKE